MSTFSHIPVLLEESLDALSLRSDGRYLDATFGRGGHSRAILSRLGKNGELFAVDRDPQAEEEAGEITDRRFHFRRAPFSRIGERFETAEAGSLDGVLFDLGVSSPQLEVAERGFSFHKTGPLDMRMDPASGISAKQWLLANDERALATIIRDWGGEPHTIARRIARAVMAVRQNLRTTTDLAAVVAEAMPSKCYKPGHHPATQTFQALRMAVNDEVAEIGAGLEAAAHLLKPGGVLVVITFHGLEDALVKRFIRAREGETVPAEIPVPIGRVNQELKLIPPVITPSAAEVAANPRCRSAKLRKGEKI